MANSKLNRKLMNIGIVEFFKAYFFFISRSKNFTIPNETVQYNVLADFCITAGAANVNIILIR
jgi:hypothetical protein